MKNRKLGFSLLEALVSLSLMSVLLGVVAALMHDTSTLMRVAANNDLLPLTTALDQISTDLRAAYQINQADAAGIELLKLDAWDTTRLPDPIPTPVPGTFSLHPAATTLKVRYTQVNGSLRCEITFPNGDIEDDEAVVGIDGLSANRLQPGLIELSVSHQDTSSNPVKVISLTTRVSLHLPPQVMP
ncbi:MAG: prepilin-type N-terminal cleavage/methylation domain-containing protein [Vulcanimicrobiota bacterium]